MVLRYLFAESRGHASPHMNPQSIVHVTTLFFQEKKCLKHSKQNQSIRFATLASVELSFEMIFLGQSKRPFLKLKTEKAKNINEKD